MNVRSALLLGFLLSLSPALARASNLGDRSEASHGPATSVLSEIQGSIGVLSCVEYDPKRPPRYRFNGPKDYVEYMKPIALLLQRHTGWPASLILAKSGLEGGWGNTTPGGFNYYGLGCSPGAKYLIPRRDDFGGDLQAMTAGCSDKMGEADVRWSHFRSPQDSAVAYAGHILMHPGAEGIVDLEATFCGAREGLKEHLYAKFPKQLAVIDRGWDAQRISKYLSSRGISHYTGNNVCQLRNAFKKQLPVEAIGAGIDQILRHLAESNVYWIPPINIDKMSPAQFQALLKGWEGHMADPGAYSRQINQIRNDPIYGIKGVDRLRLCEPNPNRFTLEKLFPNQDRAVAQQPTPAKPAPAPATSAPPAASAAAASSAAAPTQNRPPAVDTGVPPCSSLSWGVLEYHRQHDLKPPCAGPVPAK